jgi:hypothetical protein
MLRTCMVPRNDESAGRRINKANINKAMGRGFLAGAPRPPQRPPTDA